jgi:hypothetical protein
VAKPHDTNLIIGRVTEGHMTADLVVLFQVGLPFSSFFCAPNKLPRLVL